MNKRFDWQAIKLEYVQGDMSLRELARIHDVANHSLIMSQSKRYEWAKAREEFRSKAESKAITVLANEDGRRQAREVQVRDNAIDAIDEAITKMRADMKGTVLRERNGQWVEEPLVVIKPQDVAILIDRLQVLFNRPSSITEERSLGLNLSAQSDDPEFLRALVEATRGDRVDAGGAVRSPLPRIEDPRPN